MWDGTSNIMTATQCILSCYEIYLTRRLGLGEHNCLRCRTFRDTEMAQAHKMLPLGVIWCRLYYVPNIMVYARFATLGTWTSAAIVFNFLEPLTSSLERFGFSLLNVVLSGYIIIETWLVNWKRCHSLYKFSEFSQSITRKNPGNVQHRPRIYQFNS